MVDPKPSLDSRLTPARPDLAAKHLKGQVNAARFVEGTEFEIFDPVAPLRRTPSHEAALETEALKGNLNALLGDVIKAKPSTAKGQYLVKVSLTSTHGVGVVVDQSSLNTK